MKISLFLMLFGFFGFACVEKPKKENSTQSTEAASESKLHLWPYGLGMVAVISVMGLMNRRKSKS
jgi:hypothetical protein